MSRLEELHGPFTGVFASVIISHTKDGITHKEDVSKSSKAAKLPFDLYAVMHSFSMCV